MRSIRLAGICVAGLLVAAFFAPPAQPCTRVLWNDNGRSVLVGRNMDWYEDMKSNIWVLPRGMKREGLAAKNSLTWESNYGSVVITAYDVVTTDGINEKGLACHFLQLPETKTGPRDERIPGLTISLWAQYYLDNFATVVAEAVRALETQPYQLIMAVEPTTKKSGNGHIALDDTHGDSAVMECIDGKIKVYHDRAYTVLTNQPTFPKQLENLKQFRGFGGVKGLPGTTRSADRFVRGAYYVKQLPKPKSNQEAVDALMSAMRNLSPPFGTDDLVRPDVSTTIWRTVTDLTNDVLYYDRVFSRQVFWINIKKLNFTEGQPILKLTLVVNSELSGEVSRKFKEAKMFKFFGPQ